jgi:hypothetical protein
VAARLLHRLRRLQQLRPALHAARAGHDDDALAPERCASHVERRIAGDELAGGQLVGLSDRHDLLHAGRVAQGLLEPRAALADDTDDRLIRTAQQVRAEALGLDAVDHPVDLFESSIGFHDD